MIITGANQGGKSTFLRSIGVAQLMMQCGMFVPAESFSANISDGLFTHYKREEDVSMKSGKFDEELSRMSVIVDHITANSLVLFNESFAATNEREGSEIAKQIVTALLDKRVKVFFVSHLYDFARRFYDEGLPNAIFLRAERQSDGTRTYKLIEGEPLQTSYGEDLYQRIFGTNICLDRRDKCSRTVRTVSNLVRPPRLGYISASNEPSKRTLVCLPLALGRKVAAHRVVFERVALHIFGEYLHQFRLLLEQSARHRFVRNCKQD